MKPLQLAVTLALIGLTTLAEAQDLEVLKQEVRIPPGKTARFEFTTVPQKDTTILLDLMARLDSDGLGGSLYFMELKLNGQPIRAAKSRTAIRTINRAPVSPVAPNLPYSWSEGNRWRAIYAPDFEKGLTQKFYEGNPYQTVLDVTDLTNPAAENRLEITNTCTYPPPEGSKANHDLVINAIVVRIKPGASPMMAAAGEERDVINRGTPGAGPAKYTGQVLPGGGFRLQVGKEQYDFASRLSYPNAGFNHLAPAAKPDASGQPGWQVKVTPDKAGGRVVATGPDYRLERTIKFTPRKVEVSDKLTNLHADAKLGLMVANELALAGRDATVRLAGNPSPALNEYYSPGNPSVYVNLKQLGLGLICEDDIFRNQATLFCASDGKTAGLRTDMLCLPAGGSYTLQWSVYPVASGDYFDFINLVRQDWGSNYTVEGTWTFFDPDTIIATPVEKIAEQFNRLNIKRACYCGGWVDRKFDRKRIGFGTGVLDDYWADFRGRQRQAAEKIRQAVPDCKVYVYYDTQRDTAEGGHERFQDSWLTDPNGNQLSTEWGGVYSLTYSVVATLTNSYGKAMLAAVDRYLSEMKIDGLYWDEMEGVGYGTPLVDYNAPDGYSCELDPKTYTLKREIGINTIQGEGHRLAVIDRVRQLGGDLMGNGPTATKDILARKPQRMIEIQHNEVWNYEGDLQSPLGYAGGRMDFGNWLRGLKLAKLLVGTRYNYDYDIPTYSFPLTPLEIHAGYLLGKERITASHSGNFGWAGERCLVQVRHFDKAGKLTTTDFPTTVTAQEARTKVDIADDEEAFVLVRLPVEFKPVKGSATVAGVDYSPQALKLTVTAPAGAALTVRSGELKLKPGQKLRVTVGGKAQSVKVDAKGVATVSVKGTAVKVEVCP